MTTRKAIIVAAGRGRRLGNQTDDVPKCMVKVGGRPILHWQLDALASIGIDDVVIVRGYLGDRISGGSGRLNRLRFVDNAEWERNNILGSLLCAADEMAGGFFFSYSDIVYTSAVAASAAAAADPRNADVALVIDRRWDDAYLGRTEHPVSEAELALVEPATADRVASVSRVGKRLVTAPEAAGEFIGLAWFSDEGGRRLRSAWAAALASGGLDAPFGNATALRNAYLTDGLNAMTAQGARLVPAFIDGMWREIDTQQDLAAAERVLGSWSR